MIAQSLVNPDLSPRDAGSVDDRDIGSGVTQRFVNGTPCQQHLAGFGPRDAALAKRLVPLVTAHLKAAHKPADRASVGRAYAAICATARDTSVALAGLPETERPLVRAAREEIAKALIVAGRQRAVLRKFWRAVDAEHAAEAAD